MSKYYYTVGLEIHAELSTKSKMFCSCKNNPDEEQPNVPISVLCVWRTRERCQHVANKKAIESMIKVGTGTWLVMLLTITEFDRKNYFYPDIPKGYQITQYKYPDRIGWGIG
jgi:aspartyl-tRNA(Asn)/glutamyl-tRNA(Gln) amidotransferase subunit B